MALGVQKILETLKFVKKVKLCSTFNYNIHTLCQYICSKKIQIQLIQSDPYGNQENEIWLLLSQNQCLPSLHLCCKSATILWSNCVYM